MEIRFRGEKLRELCERQVVAKKKLGAACARKLTLRLQALEAVTCVTELVAGNPHPLKGDRAGQFALDLTGGWRLVFSPDHESCPTHPDGGIDWSRVTLIYIEFIGDYHD
ncbi:type II toxin-antitoxin system RelE/ParE family toxin [Comamonas flocculans]|uniref:Killer suppression protein HigA n=1 Tax=Comamonas flocculans TaxID=2597701 RepID=A0A5B8RZ31_9BURK|nr:killer suppression protein HigA [Comamonas flocculans]QEA13942.1 killer suppression protein HigA [Comamonas flocculans]